MRLFLPAIAIIAAAVVLACCAAAFAASLSAAGQSLAANRVTTPRCTNTGLLVVPNLSGTSVSTVTVSSLPSACGGATLEAAVNNGSTASTGSAVVPAGGGSVTVTLAAAVPATAGEELDVVLVGP
jgi:hypothetical protein